VADTQYASILQLEAIGISAAAISKIQAPAKNAALLTASTMINGYLRGAFTLPLIAWGADLTRACAIIAAYDLLSAKGFNPEQGSGDENVRKRFEDILAWLKLVAAGTVVPYGIEDSTPGILPSTFGGARVISAESRGYSVRGTNFEFYRGPFQTG
jgi:phage gp36-like protein